MKNYQEWYRNISSRLTSRPILLFLLRSFNRLMTVAMPLVYLILLVTTYLQLGLGQQVGVYVLIPASGFVQFCPCFVRKSITRDLMKLGISVPFLIRIVRDGRCPVAMSFGNYHLHTVCMLVYLLA